MKEGTIVPLPPEAFRRLGAIWEIDRETALAEQYRRELATGNRSVYVYEVQGAPAGEISLVRDAGDEDYTRPGQRVYVSRLLVREEFRRRGIGKSLLAFALEQAKNEGFAEASIGVDLDNYPALCLYIRAGFARVLFIGEDAYGRYVKLLKKL